VGVLLELQKRIPDGWLLRRLLPAALFVVVAVVACGGLGQRRWDDVGLARERIAAALRFGDGLSGGGVASLVLVAVAAVAAALAVPIAADGLGALVSGAWPWWLMPLSRRLTRWRRSRWAPPEEIGRRAVRARGEGRHLRADRLDARRARTAQVRPDAPTWSGDRFRAAERRVRERTGADIASGWTALLLTAPDPARRALGEAREAYGGAVEALVWSVACTALGAWWWPAAPVGAVLWLASWRSLRRTVDVLCRTAEALFEHRPPPAPGP
jgi:hypothetical protein